MVGWGLAVINSSNELKSIFNKAMREDWDPGRFAAAVRNTKWYKNHTEAWRKNEVLRLTDPQEWKARRKAIWDSVRDQAAQMGAVLSTAQVSKIVTNIQQQGWSEATIRNALADFVKFKDGMLFGQAGATGDALRQTSLDNAYKLSDNQLLDWVRAVARGDRTVEDYQRFVREQAAKKYVAFADQLRAGADLRDIAAPYIDMYAEELELNPKDIQLTDKLLTKALTWRNPNSGEVEGMDFSTWQEALRNDPRWRRTRAANEMTAGLLVDIGRAFGKLAA